MKDQAKTQEQLIDELAGLRRRVAEMEAVGAARWRDTAGELVGVFQSAEKESTFYPALHSGAIWRNEERAVYIEANI